MVLSRRSSWFLLLVGVWSWIIWPTFLKNIWKDPRSFDNGPTGFLLVHAVLVAVSLAIGTAVGVIGLRGLRGLKGLRERQASSRDEPAHREDLPVG